MANFELNLDRNGCIGCGMCAGIDAKSKYWVMSKGEAKADLVKGEERAPGKFKRLVDAPDADLKLNKSCEASCPVQVIKVKTS